MNLEDFFYWFISRAALNTNVKELYFYDQKTDAVLILNADNFEPIFYNAPVANLSKNTYYKNIFLKIAEIIIRIKNHDSQIHLLAHYSPNELKKFIEDFRNNIEGEYEKEMVSKFDWRELAFAHVKNIPTPRTQKYYDLQQAYSTELGKFLQKILDQHYYLLGMTAEKTQQLF